MRSRAVRITLMLLTIAAIGTAAYFSWTIHLSSRADHEVAATFDQTRIAALRDAYELRSTQQAYVAAGQNEAFWFGKVSELVESLRAATTALRSAAISPAALAPLDEAAAAIDEFEQADRRARSYVSGGQKLLASDVIFSAGLEAATGITAALEKAGSALTESSRAAEAEGMRRQAMAIAGAAAFAMLTLLLLTPAAAETPAAPVQEPAFGADTLRLREEVGPPQRRPAANRDPRDVQRRKVTAPGSSAASTPQPRSGPPPAPAPPSVELQGLAAVCTDLARLSDTSLLPGILERAAVALDASGLVLWIADQGGAALVPIATHGYPASVVSRMGTLPVVGQNATAAAFRTGLLQTVSASASSNGAIAAPLLAAAGCRGVMAAEVRRDAENPARLAAASILAAQLAALLGPPSSEAADDRSTAAR